MNHGDLVTICTDHGEPWVPSVRACGPVTIGAIGRHEDLADWDEYAGEVGRSETLSAFAPLDTIPGPVGPFAALRYFNVLAF